MRRGATSSHRLRGMTARYKVLALCHPQALEDAAAVKRSADRETASFEAEWRQLSKLIEADRKLQVQHWSCKSGTPPLLRSWLQRWLAVSERRAVAIEQ
jgi:hypothetical protein